MIEKGICRVCKTDGFIIDTIAICSNCMMLFMRDPNISKETRQGLKELCNRQYGALIGPSSISRMSETVRIRHHGVQMSGKSYVGISAVDVLKKAPRKS